MTVAAAGALLCAACCLPAVAGVRLQELAQSEDAQVAQAGATQGFPVQWLWPVPALRSLDAAVTARRGAVGAQRRTPSALRSAELRDASWWDIYRGGLQGSLVTQVPNDWALKLQEDSMRLVHVGATSEVLVAGVKGEPQSRVALKLAPVLGEGAKSAKNELSFADASPSRFRHVAAPLAGRVFDGRAVMLLEEAEESLEDVLQRESTLSLDESLPLLVDMLYGVQELSEAGVVHEDLTPENVLVIRGRAVLADLGRARRTEEAGAAGSDVRAVGSILARMLFGEAAEEVVERGGEGEARPLPLVASEVREVAELLGMMLSTSTGAVAEPDTVIRAATTLASQRGLTLLPARPPPALPLCWEGTWQ